MKFNTLYKRTKTGSVQVWWMELNPEDASQYCTVAGKQGGKMMKSGWITAPLTNEGRANQRTPEQQALFIVDATYTKKLESKYRESVEDIDVSNYFECMLAHSFDETKTVLDYENSEIYSNFKLDGMRCLATKDGLFSRNGKPIVCVPHIWDALKHIFEAQEDIVLDGELYNHDLKDDFNEIISNVKKTKPKPEDLVKAKELIQYHIYDVDNTGKTKLSYSIRASFIKKLVEALNQPSIVAVEATRVNSREELDKLFDSYIEQGYEGQMVRLNGEYEHFRSNNLLKRKFWIEKEYKLLRIIEGKGNWAGKAKSFGFMTEEGKDFEAGARGTMKELEKLLLNKDDFIGTMCTVRFPNYTPDGKPRFGVVKEFDRTDNLV